MNRFETQVGKKLLWTSILPLAVLSCILLVADVITLHNSQREINQNSFELARGLLTQLDSLTEQPIDQKRFNLLADILLADSEIVGLSLSNDKNHIVYQAGIPTQAAISSALNSHTFS
ncbi:MAG: hypothetical protein EOO68_32215, partial [Moraxellaceae bacterium]